MCVGLAIPLAQKPNQMMLGNVSEIGLQHIESHARILVAKRAWTATQVLYSYRKQNPAALQATALMRVCLGSH